MTKPRKQQSKAKKGTWGGFREGAGAKPKGDKAGVSHDPRPKVSPRHPLLITIRLNKGLRSMRASGSRKVLEEAFKAGCETKGMRLIHYSIQSDHLHLICEAKDKSSLSRGMQGLQIRISRRLNGFWGRKGTMFGDRYDARVLKTPQEVKSALCYVFNNHMNHGVKLKTDLDPCTSARWFDGWSKRGKKIDEPSPLAVPQTKVLTKEWRKRGLISVKDKPTPDDT